MAEVAESKCPALLPTVTEVSEKFSATLTLMGKCHQTYDQNFINEIQSKTLGGYTSMHVCLYLKMLNHPNRYINITVHGPLSCIISKLLHPCEDAHVGRPNYTFYKENTRWASKGLNLSMQDLILSKGHITRWQTEYSNSYQL